MTNPLDAMQEHIDWLELELRKEWWLNHGHDFAALYGDDGEMSCGMCIADFKRQPLDELKQIVFTARMQRAATLHDN